MITLAKDLPKRTPRERVWDAIRANADEFTIAQVADIALMKEDSARDYITGLRRAGFVQEVRRAARPLTVGGNSKQIYYRLVNDVGHEAPSVNRKGEILTPNAVNSAMWNALRIGNTPMTPRALAAYASTDRVVSEETANSYLQALRAAGYVMVVKPASYSNQATYRLLPNKNTGSKPPQIQRAKQVYDPNIGAVVYAERPELAEELRDGVHPELEVCGHE